MVRELPIGDTGADDGPLEHAGVGDPDAGVVHAGAGAPRRGELFVVDGIDDDPVFEHGAPADGDGDAEVRDAREEVRRAVEGVDDPGVLGIGAGSTTFLTEYAVVGIRTHDGVDDGVFGGAVDLGDEVVLRLLLDAQAAGAIHGAQHDPSGPAAPRATRC